ncbi:MAG: hypothetical protein ACERJ1_00435 [Halodesulfovibrio sp.]|uniref:hypothetical protein n=1 Tax=Halodesulfovibrio sp. TaxID=1912772 RepID=UPI00359CBD7B
MRFKNLGILLLMFIGLTGCVKQGFNPNGASVPSLFLGEIPVQRELASIGEHVVGKIKLDVEPDGKISVVGGKGNNDEILVRTDKKELLAFLDKSLEWSETAQKEKVNILKKMGFLNSSTSESSNTISFMFKAVEQGQLSGLQLTFRYYNINPFTPNYEREFDVLVTNANVKKMKALIGDSDKVLAEGLADHSKADLFK